MGRTEPGIFTAMPAPFSWEPFLAVPVVGILRGFDAGQTALAMCAAREGGLSSVEITMDTPDAGARIREAVREHGGHLNIGAGTVLGLAQLDRALAAGAQFIVTPTFHPHVVARCRDLGVPVFPGALSPTEIVRAWEAGASLVKVFPADRLGPGFVRNLKAPFPDIRLLPTGGVELASLPEWAAAGAGGVGVGSPLFRRDRIEAGDLAWLTDRCRAFAAAWRAARRPGSS